MPMHGTGEGPRGAQEPSAPREVTVVSSEGPDDFVVDVRNLSKVYEPLPLWMKIMLRSSISSPVTALDDVSFRVSRGEICAIVGPNGAGKSTLFRIITGLTTATTGVALIDGLDSVRDATAVRRVVGFAPADDRSLYLRHSCRENLTFHGRLQGMSGKELSKRTAEVLELVGLEGVSNRVGFALSAGMRARLQVARAMLHRPSVLILDEPTGAVDPMGSQELLEIIVGVVREERLAVLLSSHRLEEIEVLHDHVLLLDGGRAVYYGDLDSLRKVWQRPLTEVTFRTAEAARAGFDELKRQGESDVNWRTDQSLIVGTGAGTGTILTMLATQLSEITGVREVRLGTRELLAEVLSRSAEGTV